MSDNGRKALTHQLLTKLNERIRDLSKEVQKAMGSFLTSGKIEMGRRGAIEKTQKKKQRKTAKKSENEDKEEDRRTALEQNQMGEALERRSTYLRKT
eukprot:TRINITY_DN3555_c0_g1_i1.p1 TRINITY_DN3555_c0_g1~~TRINITY_DN3555_c0_g1_i1.p1  ORF type:complete len:97 (+),score=19.44 TRINITY_DN3555_c0_g1_i1:435-725(+)